MFVVVIFHLFYVIVKICVIFVVELSRKIRTRTHSHSLHAPTTLYIMGTSDGLMVSKLNQQTFTNEFESHWVPHLSKKSLVNY